MSHHNNRQVYVMRHAERVDYLFGNWFTKIEDGYERWDLNMPVEIPLR